MESDTALQEAASAAVLRPATAIAISDAASVWVSAPKPAHISEAALPYTPNFSAARRDYLAQEARNRSLGTAGELFVLDLEVRRLHSAGKKALSERVEHVSLSQGDGPGFDILSFEESGRERLIEVKTTAFGKLTPFYISRNELARSQADSTCYQLYRLFGFREKPRLFALPGTITKRCTLHPVSYLARIGV